MTLVSYEQKFYLSFFFTLNLELFSKNEARLNIYRNILNKKFKKGLLSCDVINRCLLHGSFLRRAYSNQSHNIKKVFYMLPTLPEI